MTDLRGRRMVLAVDATPRIGAGHAMRAATLAASWRALGGDVVAVGTVELPFVRRRYDDIGIRMVAQSDPLGEVLVVDRYDVADRTRLAGTAGAVKVLVYDVFGVIPAGYDVVWNPNPYASAASYPTFGGVVLAGVEVAAIRDDLPPWRRELEGDVVVSLGGGRPTDSIVAAVALLLQLMPEERFAIAGDWAPSGARVIAPGRLWDEVAAGKCLVTAAGGTLLEGAAVAVPMVVVALADNQGLAYRWARNAGVPGANAMMIDGEFLAHQLRALIPAAMIAPPLVNGAGRVAEALAQLVLDGGPA